MRFLFLLCFLNLAMAQNFQITEISPHTFGDQAEWFEFQVEGAIENQSQIHSNQTQRQDAASF